MTRSLALIVCLVFGLHGAVGGAEAPPNILLIYGDDIGYGDFGCYGAETIPTPNIDRLAAEGLRFTSGYCTSATCTPSRYSLLTGQYAWRKSGTGIAPPNAAALIKPGRVTLASLLKQQGYTTGVVGKWHLGLGAPPKPDWSGTIKPGPLEIGFDYCYLMPTTNDRVPCVYVENHRVVGLDPADPVDVFMNNPDGQPTGITHRDELKMDWSHGHNDSIVNGIGRIGFMVGGHDIRWNDEEMADRFTDKAVEFIQSRAAEPFFLYFSSQDIHVPRAPNARFVGATPHGPRGDAVVEFDACVGALMQALEKAGVAGNTLVIITSDNGPVLDDGYQDGAVTKLGSQRPAGPYRGGKYSKFEGGTRVPLIVHWPARVKPGVSDAMVSQVDFPATLARIAGGNLEDLPEEAIPDSKNLSAALLGNSEAGRELIVEQGIGSGLALREGPWKYIEPSDGKKINATTNTELGNSPRPQLYNLDNDPGERDNVASKHPERVAAMQEQLNAIQESPRKTSTSALGR